ncbi:diaminopimelate epimerase [Sporosarcina sp. PTS2304]|uniref:diaminopimelate epimerase n=1 Tax=Sporosarcina sp. PTS2304 TaxID=2283194 RepID=UPI000E0DB4C0|nr:diaminopimelate epimerase [Sporosarcina sp. PTS2304]AXI00778.1 diaminopimelate epimerase [Sporosarcina sp. PTS2304]
MIIPFTKMHGIGNNYIYLNLFTHTFHESIFQKLAIDISNVNTGIGSDGLILIHPSDVADVGMRIFNKDGSEGQSCGNGLRCVAKYAYENHLVKDKIFQIETKAALVTAEVLGSREMVEQVTVDMGPPLLKRSQIPMLGPSNDQVIGEDFQIAEHHLQITAVFIGNPNAVFFVDAIEEVPLQKLGSLITEDPRFPERTNVEFVEIVSDKEINFRVWERGSGITEACGTGACAAVIASTLNGFVQRNAEITVHLSGGDLHITWDTTGHVLMKGPAETTAEGIFYWNE